MTTTSGRGAASGPAVGWVSSLERAQALQRAVDLLRPVGDALVADPRRRDLLRGLWLGHAVHPVLTDLPLGFWMSASVLDVAGGPQARPAARKLVALGLVSAVPAAVTGLAEWAGTADRERRVGVVHAAANTTALALYAASYGARRRQSHLRGALLALAGSAAASAGGYLGGHLVSARKVSSRSPAFGG